MSVTVNGVTCSDYGSATVKLSSATTTSFTISSDVLGYTLKLNFSDSSPIYCSQNGTTNAYQNLYFNGGTTYNCSCSSGLVGKTLNVYISGVSGAYASFTFTSDPDVVINTFSVAQQKDGTAKFTCKSTGYSGSGSVSYTIKTGSTTLHSFTGSSGSTITKTTDIASSLEYGTSYTFTLTAKYSSVTKTKTVTKTFKVPSLSSPTNLIVTPSIGESTILSWTAAELLNTAAGSINYTVLKDGTFLGTTSSTSYEITSDVAKNWIGTVALSVIAEATDLSNEYSGSKLTSSESASVSFTYREPLAPFDGFTDPELTALSTKIKAVHMTEMQNRINDLLLFDGKESFLFTPIIAGQTRLTGWTNHISELRSAVDRYNSFHDAWIDIPENKPRADVVMQLRNFILGNPYQNAKRYGYRREKSNSDPSARITYLYDAEGMMPMHVDLTTGEPDYGSWKPFIDEICRPVMLKYDGTVDYELDHNDQTKKLDGTASDITNTSYAGNAMVEFKNYIWVHRSEDENYEYVIFSNVQYDDTYHAYANTNETGTVKDCFYWGMYEGTKVNDRMRSLSNGASTANQSAATEIAQAQANGSGWYVIYKSGWDYIIDILTLISKTDNSQAAFGNGSISSSLSSPPNTGTLANKSAFCGYSNETSDVKVLYMEGLWGGRWERLAGLVQNKTSGLYVKMTPPYNTSGEGYTKAVSVTGTSGNFISGSSCTDTFGYLPTSLSGSENTYMCDKVWYDTSKAATGACGGRWTLGKGCGARCLHFGVETTTEAVYTAARISYLAP